VLNPDDPKSRTALWLALGSDNLAVRNHLLQNSNDPDVGRILTPTLDWLARAGIGGASESK